VEISAKTRLLTVMGSPVAHSLSPVMYNAAFRALGIDAVYVALHVPADALQAVLAMQAATGGAGNVTVPHKAAVERYVARKTDVCARVGACNTFWTEDGGGSLVGDNTDVFGITAALDTIGARKGERWLVVGTGGSARAAAVAAADCGASLLVRSRDAARARMFVEWAGGVGVTAHVASGPVEIDVAINATPLGLAGHDPLPIDVNHMPGVQFALDLVYGPGETRWVHVLRERGVAAADGREVLVRQGAAAFERFFPGTDAPTEVMRAAVQRALRA
jgi:shikimate dehydrogenase